MSEMYKIAKQQKKSKLSKKKLIVEMVNSHIFLFQCFEKG